MAQVVSLAAAGASIAALASQPSLRALLARYTGVNSPGGIWRLLAIILVLANLKVLPGVWHIRFFRAFFYQLYLQPTRIPPHALFQPIVTSTRAPALEIDYNIHKSNSTYFADMDISRTHLFTAIIRRAIQKSSRLYGHKKGGIKGVGATSGTRGKHMIALGGIACQFKKEIPPYQKYEMWTRLLCWDRKWFYLVTHLVKPGVGKPSQFSLQPWRKGKKKEGEKIDAEKLKNAVFATAIARYVIKAGRITVPPEQALADAEMVPAKPEGWVYNEEIGVEIEGTSEGKGMVEGKEVEWDWNVIERERRRGLKFAEAFSELDGLHGVFEGGLEGVLGEYPDLLWR